MSQRTLRPVENAMSGGYSKFHEPFGAKCNRDPEHIAKMRKKAFYLRRLFLIEDRHIAMKRERGEL